MTDVSAPERCLLCEASSSLRPARFRQLYSQAQGPPVEITWWVCRACAGWFAFPTPSVEQIERHLASIRYNAPSQADTIFTDKQRVFETILDGLFRRKKTGRLLDFGCNYGHFLEFATGRGWEAVGFEPAPGPADYARQRGAEVRCAWSLDQAGFDDGTFDAIVAVDTFYYVWHPSDTLRTFHRLLRPGGVLVMRISNKNAFFRLVARLTRSRDKLDKRMSRLLGDHFHSIGMRPLAGVLAAIGFESVQVEPGATTVPLGSAPRRTRWAYGLADWTRRLTAGRLVLSPGVLVWAMRRSDR